MSLKVPNGELIDALEDLMAGRYAGAKIKLYKNDKTPAAGDVLADYTEADFSGYAEQALSPDGAVAMVGARAVQAFDPNVFTHNGGATNNSIYGYYVVDSGETLLLWAERYAGAPGVINTLNQTYTVVPQLTNASEF